MLSEHQFGYAIMSRDLQGIGGEFSDIGTCKKYCFNGDVIVERIPKVCGIQVEFNIFHFMKKPYVHRSSGFFAIHFMWFYLKIRKTKRHVCGAVVYDSKEQT